MPKLSIIQAQKGRKKTAQDNALGNAGLEAQNPEWARQNPAICNSPSLRPLKSILREPLRNGHSATASGDPNGIRTLTLTAVTVGDFSERNTKITSADAHRVKDLWLEPGDILIQRSNAPELVGTSRLYRGDRNYAIFPDLMIRVRLNDEADPRFIELVLQSEPLRQYFKGRAKGMSGSMPKIDQETISEAPIPHFDIDDQRRIVAEIEKQFTRLEAGVAALRRVQANLKRYRAAVLKSACGGKFASNKTFPYSKQQLGNLGKWCGGGTPSKANLAFWASGNIPWVSPKDMKTEIIADTEDHITKEAVENSTTNLLPPNAVLVVTRSGILAHTLPVAVTTRTVALNQDIKALQLSPDNNSRYVALALRAHQQEILQSCTKAGTTVQSIEFPVFLRFEIPLPPLAEQTRIVAEVERRLSVVEELEAVVTTNLQRATRLRQSVLQKAFTGEL